MQLQDPHPHMTLFLTMWAAIGPLAGILVGHFLTRSWQREQWRLDNRKQEYRELLSSLTKAYMNLMRGAGSAIIAMSPEMEKEIGDSKIEAYRVLRDRIFIAEELDISDILGRWNALVVNFEADRDARKCANRFTELNQALVQMALTTFTRPGALRRWYTRRHAAIYRARARR